ncbi:hypothetical protein SOVF_062420 isoform B [Spinacia oleracea]|nr:hypothetical protein SOVF_062420 isoform B [Spinacia oleracea]
MAKRRRRREIDQLGDCVELGRNHSRSSTNRASTVVGDDDPAQKERGEKRKRGTRATTQLKAPTAPGEKRGAGRPRIACEKPEGSTLYL